MNHSDPHYQAYMNATDQAARLQTEANYWKAVAHTEYTKWAGQHSHKSPETSPTPGSAAARLIKLIALTFNSRGNNKNGKK